ncbi:hypothetical protein LEMLEM_LOCUS18542 [Lemmus lemmus]
MSSCLQLPSPSLTDREAPMPNSIANCELGENVS